MRALTLTGAIALVAFAGACSQPVHDDGLAAPATIAPSTAPTAAPVVRASTPSADTTTAADAPEQAASPCPVSAATLFGALRKSELYDRAGKPDGLAKPSCDQGFAYVRSTFQKAPEGEIAWVLFKFDTKARDWQVLNLGTGGVCEGFVSQSVQDRLNEGAGGGC